MWGKMPMVGQEAHGLFAPFCPGFGGIFSPNSNNFFVLLFIRPLYISLTSENVPFHLCIHLFLLKCNLCGSRNKVMDAKIKTLRALQLFHSIFHLIHFGLTQIIFRTGNLAHRIYFITRNAQK